MTLEELYSKVKKLKESLPGETEVIGTLHLEATRDEYETTDVSILESELYPDKSPCVSIRLYVYDEDEDADGDEDDINL